MTPLTQQLFSLMLSGCTYRDLSQVAGRAALHQRHVRCQTHSVHVVPRRPVVQRVQHQGELLEEVDPVVGTEVRGGVRWWAQRKGGGTGVLRLAVGGECPRELASARELWNWASQLKSHEKSGTLPLNIFWPRTFYANSSVSSGHGSCIEHLCIDHSTQMGHNTACNKTMQIRYLVANHGAHFIMLSWWAFRVVSGLNPWAASHATLALDFPTCSRWNRNCRFRLLTSIVSRSIWKGGKIEKWS